MVHNLRSTSWMPVAVALAATSVLGSVSCGKPQPSAPTQDFAQRHRCSVGEVEVDKETSNRMRLTGCGKSEVYVRICESGGPPPPPNEVRQPITEAEAKHTSIRRETFSREGCAWTRQQPNGPSRTDGKPQPRWLAEP